MPTMSTQGTSGGTPDILGAFNTTSALANTDGGGGGWLKNTFMNEGGGLNMDAIGGLAETIGAFGSLWSGIQSNKIAKKSLKFQEKAFNTNLTNQLQSYNTALSDRANARYQRAGSPEDAAGYIERNKLKAT